MFSKAKLPTRLREIAKILKAANCLWYFETCVPISRLLTVSMQFLTWHLHRFSFYCEKCLLRHCETSREFVESSNVQVEYILGFGAAVVIVLTIIIVLILYLILQCKQKRRERQLRWVDTLLCTTLHTARTKQTFMGCPLWVCLDWLGKHVITHCYWIKI